MPRPRKPVETLKLSGAFEKNPKRTRARHPGEIKSDKALGEPPDYFADDEATVWAEIQTIVPSDVLTSADRFVVELLSRLVAKFRRDWLTGAEMSQMTWCCSHLGMTPTDRSKITVRQEKEASPFDEFLAN